MIYTERVESAWAGVQRPADDGAAPGARSTEARGGLRAP
jgi:hypothetical protein